ncbi:hypothetical protein [Streptomyces sp. Je 1-369]|uniref:hypothetical protein n=1 Tax=Streptomyces sp. Je 1-369 TaxID=2966192 RepID=UPI0039E1AA32
MTTTRVRPKTTLRAPREQPKSPQTTPRPHPHRTLTASAAHPDRTPAVPAPPGLRRLDLRGNPLAALPDWLAELPALEKLDLRWTDAPVGRNLLDGLESRGCVVLY